MEVLSYGVGTVLLVATVKPENFTSQHRQRERENQQHVNYDKINNLVAKIEQTVPKVVEQIGFITIGVHV